MTRTQFIFGKFHYVIYGRMGKKIFTITAFFLLNFTASLVGFSTNNLVLSMCPFVFLDGLPKLLYLVFHLHPGNF